MNECRERELRNDFDNLLKQNQKTAKKDYLFNILQNVYQLIYDVNRRNRFVEALEFFTKEKSDGRLYLSRIAGSMGVEKTVIDVDIPITVDIFNEIASFFENDKVDHQWSVIFEGQEIKYMCIFLLPET